MNVPKCIAYFRFGSLSHVNKRVLEILREHFPENPVVERDVWELMGHKAGLKWNLLAHALRLYGSDILTRRRGFRDCLLYTPFGFEQIRQHCRAAFRGMPVRFSLQTQSFFDGSLGVTPHFLYTDHTHLANLANPCFDRRRLWHPAWIEKEREIYGSASMNMVWSENIRQSIIQDYAVPADRVRCVFVGCNAVDAEGMVDLSLARYARQQIVFVGVAWERKGGPELLEAFQLVRAQCAQAKLVIVGCSPRIDVSGVEVIGRVSPDRVHEFLKQSSVFCMPTRIEPFGIAVVEAMSLGLPVVSTKIEAIPEIVEEGRSGFLVNPRDSAATAQALIKLLTSPELCARMGRRGHEIASEKYTWARTAPRMVDAINSVIGRVEAVDK